MVEPTGYVTIWDQSVVSRDAHDDQKLLGKWMEKDNLLYVEALNVAESSGWTHRSLDLKNVIRGYFTMIDGKVSVDNAGKLHKCASIEGNMLNKY